MAIICFGLGVFFAFAFYDRFWVWRHQLAEVKSSFVTPEGANVTSGGAFWIVPAVAFFALGVFLIITASNQRRKMV